MRRWIYDVDQFTVNQEGKCSTSKHGEEGAIISPTCGESIYDPLDAAATAAAMVQFMEFDEASPCSPKNADKPIMMFSLELWNAKPWLQTEFAPAPETAECPRLRCTSRSMSSRALRALRLADALRPLRGELRCCV